MRLSLTFPEQFFTASYTACRPEKRKATLRSASTSANSVTGTGTIACSGIEKNRSDWLSLILVARWPVNARFQLGFRSAHAQIVMDRLVARPNSPKSLGFYVMKEIECIIFLFTPNVKLSVMCITCKKTRN